MRVTFNMPMERIWGRGLSYRSSVIGTFKMYVFDIGT
jgi:hypothetical protein